MDLNLWKNKDELKKFLDNLGTEYRFGCFEENNSEACHLLGDYLLSIDKANNKAAQVYRMNCDENKYGLSCDAYGRMVFKGQSIEAPSYQLALDYFSKGCELNEPRSCYHGGQMYGVIDKRINKIITPDPKKSINMLTKACLSTKQPLACTLLHSFYLRGFHDHPADMKKASELALLGCDQDEPTACYNLSRMYHLGEGVEKADQEKSKYYFKRAQEIFKKAKTDFGKVSGQPDL